MENNHLVKVLSEKRAEVSGVILELERELAKHRAALVHLDATLRLLDPSINIADIRAKGMSKRSGYFAAGEISTRCLDAIRVAAPQGVSADEVAVMMLKEKEIDPSDELLRTDFIRRIHNAMDRLQRTRIVRRVGRGRGVRWALLESGD